MKNLRKYSPIISIIILLTLFSYWLASLSLKAQENSAIEQKTQINHGDLDIISGIANPIDGDSIKIKPYGEIRLLGIDAPEYSQNCLDENGKEYRCGMEASYFLKKLIKGKKIECFYTGLDFYKRYLAICYLGDSESHQEMLRKGMAIIYDLRTASDELKQIEEEARAKKIGVWRGSFLEPKEYRRLNKR
ncbi:MAG: thermonuclease family protein [Proteobacteria bacterium]|nr:thermonuclease family protein [Pseudomonadota bacterium]